MKVHSIYFSPTGGTKKVMDILAGEWQQKEELDLSLPEKDYGIYRFERGDVCLIGVPSFGGRVPSAAIENLKKIRADRSAAILVVAYGNRAYDDTMLELRKTAEGCGFKVVAAIAAVAEHSIAHKYGAGRPDAADQEVLRGFVKKIREKLAAPRLWKDFFVPGRYPYREWNGGPVPAVTSSCTRCGVCAEKCPVGAISLTEPSKTDETKCIACMRCISVCPSHARKLNAALVAALTLKLHKACAERKEAELFM